MAKVSGMFKKNLLVASQDTALPLRLLGY